MAIYTRTFWTVEGKNDKDGHPIEFPTQAAAAQASSGGGIAGTGIGAGLGPIPAATPATKVTESMSEDGEYVQTTEGPDGQPQEISRGVDKARLELYNARRSAAKDNAAAKPGYHTLPNGDLAVEDPAAPGGLRVVATKPQGPQQAEAQPIHTLPSGEQVAFNPATGKWDHFADPKAPAVTGGDAPLAVPASRPGQTTDLGLVKAQGQQLWNRLTADVQAHRITDDQRWAQFNAWNDATARPAMEQATKEANDYAAQQQRRQQEADARSARTETRQDTTAERQAKTAEEAQRLNEQKFSYSRGQDAVSNALKLAENQVDPSFGPALAGIYNRIMPGAFPSNAFTTASPDLDAIAAAHVGPLVDMHEQSAVQQSAAVPAGYPQAAPPAVPPAFGPRTTPPQVPYPQPGGTGVVGRFGQ